MAFNFLPFCFHLPNWNYRPLLSCLVYVVLGTEPGFPVCPVKHSTSWATSGFYVISTPAHLSSQWGSRQPWSAFSSLWICLQIQNSYPEEEYVSGSPLASLTQSKAFQSRAHIAARCVEATCFHCYSITGTHRSWCPPSPWWWTFGFTHTFPWAYVFLPLKLPLQELNN